MRRLLSSCFCLLLILPSYSAIDHMEDFDPVAQIEARIASSGFVPVYVSSNLCYPENRPDACHWLKSQTKQQINEIFGESDSQMTIFKRLPTPSIWRRKSESAPELTEPSKKYSDAYFYGAAIQEIFYVININTTIHGRRAATKLGFKRNFMEFTLKATEAQDRYSDWDFWLSDSPMVTAEKREIVYDNDIVNLLLHNVTLLRSGFFMESVRITAAEIQIRGLQKSPSKFIMPNARKADRKPTLKEQSGDEQTSIRMQVIASLLDHNYWKDLSDKERMDALEFVMKNDAGVPRKEDLSVALEAACRLYLKMSVKRPVTVEIDAFDSPY